MENQRREIAQLHNIDFYDKYKELRKQTDTLIEGLTEQCEQFKQSQNQKAIEKSKVNARKKN